jgi:hypothetical protein
VTGRWTLAGATLGGARLGEELERVLRPLAGDAGSPAEPSAEEFAEPFAGVRAETRLDQVVRVFRLSGFERDLLLWCAGLELDSRFGRAFAAAHGDPQRAAPTFGLALATLADPHWDALTPAGPLRFWRLVEAGTVGGLVDRPLRVDERILAHLIGVDCLDPRLDGMLRAESAGGRLTGGQVDAALDIAGAVERLGAPAAVTLSGADAVTRRRVAAQVAASVGLPLVVLSGPSVPAAEAEAAAVLRLVERDVALLGALLLVEVPAEAPAHPALSVGLARLGCPMLLSGGLAVPEHPRPARREVPVPTPAEQRALWTDLLGAGAPAGAVRDVAAHFRFGVPDVEAVATELSTMDRSGDDEDCDGAGDALRAACRVRARAGLDGLAQRVEPHAGWDDLVLPDPSMHALRDVARQVRHRQTVYHDWGMADGVNRGLGVSALFTGDSGTGKTLAAEVLAADLGLDLYQIDLSALVSKYIGETEKNLRTVFDTAEASGAVLLFDEADALFGKRSEVKDSHDRYANVEVSYLLQRMESYRGLAILTTNLRQALDRAFLRRIRAVVSFPFPDHAGRQRIWRLNLPPSLPVDGVDLARLARLQVAGGNIRTIALGAAFIAAEEGGTVTMAHLLAATRREYAKLEKTLTDAETGGWV